MSRTLQLPTGLAGLTLVGSALAILGYALAAGAQPTGAGLIAVVVLLAGGAVLLRRAGNWSEPRYCPSCGTQAPAS